MDSSKRMIKFQNQWVKKSLTSIWIIMITLDLLGYAVNYYSSKTSSMGLVNDDLLSVAGANALVIGIFLVTYGIMVYYENFPIAIGFSATRGDFCKAVIISNIIMCLAIAVVFGLLMYIDRFIVRAIGRQPMVEFGIFNTAEDNILYIIFSMFILFLTLISLVNFVGSLLYKVGWIKFLIGYLAITILVKLYNNSIWVNMWDNLRKTLTTRITPISLIYLLITIFTSYILGYLVIKRTNIKCIKN